MSRGFAGLESHSERLEHSAILRGGVKFGCDFAAGEDGAVMGNPLKLFGIALTVAMGGFLVGFDATVISGAVPFIREYFDLGSAAGTFKLGWAVSSLGWGAMAGNL